MTGNFTIWNRASGLCGVTGSYKKETEALVFMFDPMFQIIYTLLKNKSEQERKLLSALVNKVLLESIFVNSMVDKLTINDYVILILDSLAAWRSWKQSCVKCWLSLGESFIWASKYEGGFSYLHLMLIFWITWFMPSPSYLCKKKLKKSKFVFTGSGNRWSGHFPFSTSSWITLQVPCCMVLVRFPHYFPVLNSTDFFLSG